MPKHSNKKRSSPKKTSNKRNVYSHVKTGQTVTFKNGACAKRQSNGQFRFVKRASCKKSKKGGRVPLKRSSIRSSKQLPQKTLKEVKEAKFKSMEDNFPKTKGTILIVDLLNEIKALKTQSNSGTNITNKVTKLKRKILGLKCPPAHRDRLYEFTNIVHKYYVNNLDELSAIIKDGTPVCSEPKKLATYVGGKISAKRSLKKVPKSLTEVREEKFKNINDNFSNTLGTNLIFNMLKDIKGSPTPQKVLDNTILKINNSQCPPGHKRRLLEFAVTVHAYHKQHYDTLSGMINEGKTCERPKPKMLPGYVGGHKMQGGGQMNMFDEHWEEEYILDGRRYEHEQKWYPDIDLTNGGFWKMTLKGEPEFSTVGFITELTPEDNRIREEGMYRAVENGKVASIPLDDIEINVGHNISSDGVEYSNASLPFSLDNESNSIWDSIKIKNGPNKNTATLYLRIDKSQVDGNSCGMPQIQFNNGEWRNLLEEPIALKKGVRIHPYFDVWPLFDISNHVYHSANKPTKSANKNL